MKEPIIELKEWLQQQKAILTTKANLEQDGYEKLALTIRAIAFADVMIKLQEIELASDSAFLDKLIEEGRLAESIKHHAVNDGITAPPLATDEVKEQLEKLTYKPRIGTL